MFIGSSQTWGAGASSYEKTFPAIFEKILNNKIIELPPDASSASQVLGVSTDQKIKIVNTGISGVTSSELLEEYQSEWIKLKPKILFINLSSNDFTYGDFETKFKNNIENFIELNENNNIRTVLLIEAGSVELNRKNPLHQILTEIAKNEKILLIDIDQYLKDKNQTGLIWWDYVHLTDYGHQLVAEYILNMVIESDESIQSTLR
jgi:lysophospholipase L1-like esterase